jgi:hypothetical protein
MRENFPVPELSSYAARMVALFGPYSHICVSPRAPPVPTRTFRAPLPRIVNFTQSASPGTWMEWLCVRPLAIFLAADRVLSGS